MALGFAVVVVFDLDNLVFEVCLDSFFDGFLDGFFDGFFDDFFGGVELISSLTQQVRTIMQGQTTVESKLGFIPH